MRERVGNWVAASLILALVAVVFASSANIPQFGQESDPGSAFYPRIVAVGLAILAVGLALQRGGWESFPRGKGAVRVGAILLLLIFYAGLLEVAGFILATFLFLISSLLITGVRRLLVLALLPAGVSVAVFYVFYRLLEVSLPRGIVEGLLF